MWAIRSIASRPCTSGTLRHLRHSGRSCCTQAPPRVRRASRRAGSTGPAIPSTRNTRSSAFAASAFTACRSCRRALSTIAACRTRMPRGSPASSSATAFPLTGCRACSPRRSRVVLAFRLARVAQGSARFGAHRNRGRRRAAVDHLQRAVGPLLRDVHRRDAGVGAAVRSIRPDAAAANGGGSVRSGWRTCSTSSRSCWCCCRPACGCSRARRIGWRFPYRMTALALAAFLAGEATVFLLHFTVSGAPFRTIHDYAALHALPVGWELPGQPGADRPYLLFDAGRWWQVLGRCRSRSRALSSARSPPGACECLRCSPPHKAH